MPDIIAFLSDHDTAIIIAAFWAFFAIPLFRL